MLYAIQFWRLGYIKFGVSENPAERLSDLQTASPVDLELVAAAHWGDNFERRIHEFLRQTRLRGEWFDRGEDHRVAFVLDCMQDPETGKCRFVDAYKDHLAAVAEEQRKRRAEGKVMRRQQERMAWWMDCDFSPSSRARSGRDVFEWDGAGRRWVKAPGHAAGGPEIDGA